MSDRLAAKKKAEQLMALACSTQSEDEARNAALAAVNLIRSHELHLSLAEQKEERPKPEPKESSAPVRSNIAGAWGGARLIKVGYPAFCLECRVQFYSGDRAYWLAGVGCLCIDCRNKKTGVKHE